MKKSKAYRAALSAIIRDAYLDAEEKIDILEILFDSYGTALFTEKLNEEKGERA